MSDLDTPALHQPDDDTSLSGDGAVVPGDNNVLSATTPSRSELDAHIASLHTMIDASVEELLTQLQIEVWDSFAALWDHAAQKHQEILDEAHILEGDVVRLIWKNWVDYRRQVHRQIFLRVNRSLTPSVVSRIESKASRFFSELSGSIEAYPQTITVPQQGALFVANAGDGLSTRYKKWIQRNRRNARQRRHATANFFRRLIRRPIRSLPVATQDIPLRHLISYHIQVRLNACVRPVFKSIHDVLTTHLATFESSQADWLHAVLNVEGALYHPNQVLDEDEKWLPSIDPQPSTLDAERFQASATSIHALDTSFQFDPQQWESLAMALNEVIEKAWEDLLHDLERGGTILLSVNERPVPARPSSYMLASDWRIWHEEFLQRLKLSNLVLGFRDRLLSSNHQLIKSVSAASIQPLTSSYEVLRKSIEEGHHAVQESLESASEHPDFSLLRETLTRTHKKLTGTFATILEDVTVLVKSSQALEHSAKKSRDQLIKHVESFPELVTVHTPSKAFPDIQRLTQNHYSFHFQDLVLKPLQEPTYLLNKPADTLQRAIVHTWGETQEVQQDIDYNLDAAFEELQKREASVETQAEPHQTSKDAVDAAKELIEEGLTRSREKLNKFEANLYEPWNDFVAACFQLTRRQWQTTYEDLLFQDDVHGWLTNARIQLFRSLDNFIHWFSEARTKSSRRLRLVARLGRRQTQQLIKKGQSAVGVVEQSEEEWLQTLNLVSDISSLHERLPPIYRRLFSFRPLQEENLLEGRDGDLEFIRQHYERWQEGQTGPLVLAMAEGSGRTSLMNVISHVVFRDTEVHRVVLDGRIEDIDSGTQLIMSALSISESDLDATFAPSSDPLETLEKYLTTSPRSPRVVLIDNFEQFLLCAPGGETIIERILLMLSRTDTTIYWIININQFAWHFLERTIKPSFGFITVHTVQPITRPALEQIILRRHQRSSMSLRYSSEIATSSLFSFTRPKDDKAQQLALQQSFFERLHRLTGQNIQLALLYWLRSVTSKPKDDTLYVDAIDAINFSFLDTLDQTRAFTLKMLLIHGTLTLEEHMRLFKLGETESTFIMESLLNLRIIEPNLSDLENTQRFRIVSGTPYKLHALIRHPVVSYLRALHIIY